MAIIFSLVKNADGVRRAVSLLAILLVIWATVPPDLKQLEAEPPVEQISTLENDVRMV